MTKPTKEEMLARIYEVIAKITTVSVCENCWEYESFNCDCYWVWVLKPFKKPILVWDCLKWMSESVSNHSWLVIFFEEILNERSDYSWPIDDEPDAIEYMYDLVVIYKNESETSTPEA